MKGGHSDILRFNWGRWLRLTIAGILVALLLLAAAPLVWEFCVDHTRIPDFPSRIDIVWRLVVAMMIVFGLVGWQGGKGRMAAYFGLLHFWSYPPVWVGGAVAYLVMTSSLLWGTKLVGTISQSQTIVVGLSLAAALFLLGMVAMLRLDALVSWCAMRRKLRPVAQANLPESAELLLTNFKALKAWLSNDRPIEALEHDAFGRAYTAKRVTDLLAPSDKDTADPGIVVLVGEKGAGKSSTLEMAKRLLAERRSNVHWVDIQLWSYDSLDGAIRGILDALITSLGTKVPTVGLGQISTRYLRIIDGDIPFWAKLPGIAWVQPTPGVVLNRIDEIAKAIGVEFVLCIQDLERFDVEHDERSAGQSALVSLLFHLAALEKMGVIVAVDELRHLKQDDKLARHVEYLYAAGRRDTGKLLKFFRAECIAEKSILLPSGIDRTSLEGLEERNFARLTVLDPRNIAEAVVELCSNLRSLKRGMQRCYDDWQYLRGEVAYDDLLILSLLREGDRRVFDAMRRHIDALRSPHKSDRHKARELFIAELGAADVKARLNGVADFLFGKADGTFPPRPQGITDPTRDYWHRMMAPTSLAALTHSELDQPILQQIETREPARIAELLRGSATANATENFATHLPGSVLEEILDALSAHWPIPGSVPLPGLEPIWRMLKEATARDALAGQTLHKRIRNILERVTPVGLGAANQIDYYFLDSEPGQQLLTEQHLTQLRTFRQELLLRIFSGHPEKLIEALRWTPTDTLLQAMWGPRALKDGNRPKKPFARWPQLNETFFKAIEKDAAVILPRLSEVLVHKGETGLAFDPARAGNFFEINRLMDAFKLHPVPNEVHTEAYLAVFRAAQSYGFELPPKANWVVFAHPNHAAYPPQGAITGKKRWTTNAAMNGADEWFQIDFGKTIRIKKVVVSCVEGTPDNGLEDFPRKYEIIVSDQPKNIKGQPQAAGDNDQAELTVKLSSPAFGRYLLIRQLGQHESRYWSIYRIDVE